jgi:hypothetical protein
MKALDMGLLLELAHSSLFSCESHSLIISTIDYGKPLFIAQLAQNLTQVHTPHDVQFHKLRLLQIIHVTH